MSAVKILIVEDEGIEALDIQQTLIIQGYTAPHIVSSGEEAVQKVEETSPDLVLMDIMLQGEMDGISTAKLIHDRFDIPIIYITAYTDPNTLQRAKLTEPYGYLVKPFNRRELCTTIDMALYKHSMEKELKEREKWFATTFRSIGDAIITTDERGLITFMNPVAEGIMGWKLDEVLHQPQSELFNVINLCSREPAENPIAGVLNKDFSVGLADPLILTTKNGIEVPIEFDAAPIKDNKGTTRGVVLVFRDVTERHRAEKSLRDSEERYRILAEERCQANQRINEFLGILSHELRNPLAAIRNSLNILDNAVPDREQAKRAHEVVNRQIGQLTRLVDDLLDITRITQNKIKLQRQRLELNELVRLTIEDYHLLFEKNGLYLETEYAPSLIFVYADGARLGQVVGNLLQNAAKFTCCGGSIRVSVKIDASLKRVLISVTDTGVGLAPEMLSIIFQPFRQAEATLERSNGGLGLGLAVSKGLVELHDGDISAFSAGIGKGAEFVVRIPLVEPPIEELKALPLEISHNSRQVLIIEDNVDIADTLRELLELNRHDVTVAYNGSEGLTKAREFCPEILLCDIGLPGMTGYDIARAFRQDEILSDVFLVAMTGYTLPGDIKQSSDAGFNRHLAKPVDLDEINRILAQVPIKIPKENKLSTKLWD